MTDIVTLPGKHNCGKSETLRLVLKELRRKYNTPLLPQVVFREDRVDFKIVLEINGELIGLESQRDPNSRILRNLEDFSIINCHTIICATRAQASLIVMLFTFHLNMAMCQMK